MNYDDAYQYGYNKAQLESLRFAIEHSCPMDMLKELFTEQDIKKMVAKLEAEKLKTELIELEKLQKDVAL